MDSLITAAARALAAGDPLGALKRVALRDDAPALALRGIAMAQLGDLARAKALLRRAARAFGPKEAVARARCVVAEAEIALVSRDLGWPAKALDAARATLEAHGDRVERGARALSRGPAPAAARPARRGGAALAALDPAPLPSALRRRPTSWSSPASRCGACATKRRARRSRAPRAAARSAGIPALTAEVGTRGARADARRRRG